MERHPISESKPHGYYTAPWRKSRICARFVLRPELLNRPHYAALAAGLVRDSSVTNRLIAQAVAQLTSRQIRRDLAA